MAARLDRDHAARERKMRQQLTEQTRYFYHLPRPPVSVLLFRFTPESNNAAGRASIVTCLTKVTLDKSEPVDRVLETFEFKESEPFSTRL